MRRLTAAVAFAVLSVCCLPGAEAAPAVPRHAEHASVRFSSPGRNVVKLRLVTRPMLSNAIVRVHVVSKEGRRLLGRRHTDGYGYLTTTFRMPGPRKYFFEVFVHGTSRVSGERTKLYPLLVKY